MVDVRPLAIPEVLEITPKKFDDDRGFFSETYNRVAFADAGVHLAFVQDNHSFSAAKGTLRGLHYQAPPIAQDKLVRCTRGKVFDVAVDIREGSPTFGQWVGVTLSAKDWNQLLVPKGFAHGFVTLVADCEVLYKTTDYYSSEHDRSIRFDDPGFSVDWPIDSADIILSDKDKNAPLMAQIGFEFSYQDFK